MTRRVVRFVLVLVAVSVAGQMIWWLVAERRAREALAGPIYPWPPVAGAAEPEPETPARPADPESAAAKSRAEPEPAAAKSRAEPEPAAAGPPAEQEPAAAKSSAEPERAGARLAPGAAAAVPRGEPAAGWVEPVEHGCPAGYPVKVKLRSRLYHLPGMAAYERTSPDRCYATAEAAESEGFSRPKH